MAFRTQQRNVSMLLLLSVCLHFMTENRTAAISLREKCECIEETGSVQWRKIKDYTIIPKDAFCNKVQIILQLIDKRVCLNPESKKGKQLQRCWKRIEFNTRKKKVCLLKRKRNGPKSPKKN
ncbi:chemokine (C-X-C motif) ligand 18a, duplicate 1 [Pimephales promelas]|uniref:chemokine (C-X-C motif) ligand 18a, duplicate 1 n=1 Tax=Pimephales promelas TaxID=90988 RepID=UPI001955E33F|nr:chemokine (C-X-C motif) ligand 18a, duplicate 1 [Pimephales promelas]